MHIYTKTYSIIVIYSRNFCDLFTTLLQFRPMSHQESRVHQQDVTHIPTISFIHPHPFVLTCDALLSIWKCIYIKMHISQPIINRCTWEIWNLFVTLLALYGPIAEMDHGVCILMMIRHKASHITTSFVHPFVLACVALLSIVPWMPCFPWSFVVLPFSFASFCCEALVPVLNWHLPQLACW